MSILTKILAKKHAEVEELDAAVLRSAAKDSPSPAISSRYCNSGGLANSPA
jgi:hypothetical protein